MGLELLTAAAPIIGAGVSAIGNIFGANKSAETAAQNNAMQLAWEREKFGKEIELANTAHQREMADYRAAGINPLLTIGGKGASVPSANAINPQMPDYSGYGRAGDAFAAGIQNTITNIREQRIAEANIKKAEADADKAQTEADAIRKDYEPGGIKEKEIQKRNAEIEAIQESTNLTRAEAEKVQREAEHIAIQTAYQEIVNEIRKRDLNMYYVDKIVGYVMQGLSIIGIGKILANFAGPKGDIIIKNMTSNEVQKAFKPENTKEWMNENQISRYTMKGDQLLDRATGELIDFSFN